MGGDCKYDKIVSKTKNCLLYNRASQSLPNTKFKCGKTLNIGIKSYAQAVKEGQPLHTPRTNPHVTVNNKTTWSGIKRKKVRLITSNRKFITLPKTCTVCNIVKQQLEVNHNNITRQYKKICRAQNASCDNQVSTKNRFQQLGNLVETYDDTGLLDINENDISCETDYKRDNIQPTIPVSLSRKTKVCNIQKCKTFDINDILARLNVTKEQIETNRAISERYKENEKRKHAEHITTNDKKDIGRNNMRNNKYNRKCEKLKCLYSNVDSLSNKMEELKLNIKMQIPDVVIITEVLPKSYETKPTTESININGYELYTNIAEDDIRGVALYVKSELESTEVKFESISKENVWCTIKLKNNEDLLLGCIYRSPTNDNENTLKLTKLLQEVIDTNPQNLIITGDFNYKEINWASMYSSHTENHRTNIFLEKIKDLFLYQHVTEFTRYRVGQKPSLLDLILTNKEEIVKNVCYLPSIGKSDHICITFESELCVKNVKSKVPRYNYHKGDYVNMTKMLKEID